MENSGNQVEIKKDSKALPIHKIAPGPKGHPIFGAIADIYKKGFLQGLAGLYRDYGSFVRITGPFGKELFLVTHPDDVKHIAMLNHKNYNKGAESQIFKLLIGNGLPLTEGKTWQKQRKLMQPSFTPPPIKHLTPVMIACTQDMLKAWSQHAQTKSFVNVSTELSTLVQTIIAKALFSTGIEEDLEVLNRCWPEVMQFITDRGAALFKPPLWWPLPRTLRFKKALKNLDRVIFKIIHKRRALGPEASQARDMLSALMRARDDNSNEIMSEQQLRDEVITMLFAGHESTTALIAWALHHLNQHPQWAESARAELDRELRGQCPDFDNLNSIPTIKMILEETLRISPPSPLYIRSAYEDDTIRGFHLPKDKTIIISPFATQRIPEFWPDPESFNPLRFSNEEKAKRNAYSYFPFGIGPRACIGEFFAMTEAQLILALILQHFELEPDSQRPAKESYRGTLQLENFWVQLKLRSTPK